MQTWTLAHHRSLTLERPRILAILNVTPDSFSDGGQFIDPERAVDRALGMIDDGADMLDLGAESTRPGATRVDAAEQLRRLMPVLERVRATSPDVPISIDTTLAEVAQATLAAGADAVNDVSAGTEDEAMLQVVADEGAGIVLMHRLAPPDHDEFSHAYQQAPVYGDLHGEIAAFLSSRAEGAIRAGVPRTNIVIDPGLGFGKSVEDNYSLIRGSVALSDHLRLPVLAAASRKSFIGKVSGVIEPGDRLHGSLAVSIYQYLQGVRLFRVHDVKAHREAFAVACRLLGSRSGSCE